MGVQTDVVIADLNEAQAIAETATPTAGWEGFSFNGFDHVQLCSLLSLLCAGNADAEFERNLGVVEPASAPAEEGPLVVAVMPDQVAELAAVARMETDEFESLASSWAAIEEFDGWSASDARELLRELGDLADSASLHSRGTAVCPALW